MFDGEKPGQCGRVISRVKKFAQPNSGRVTQIVVVGFKRSHRPLQLTSKHGHLDVEVIDIILPDQADARFRVGQRTFPPVSDGLTTDGGHCLERRVGGIKQLFTCRDELALGPEGVGSLVFLGAVERLVNAQPGEADTCGGHRVPQNAARGGGVGRLWGRSLSRFCLVRASPNHWGKIGENTGGTRPR